MRELYQELLLHLTAKDLPEIEDHQLARWHENGCQNFPNCTTGKCNPGCDLEQTFGDGMQWGAL